MQHGFSKECLAHLAGGICEHQLGDMFRPGVKVIQAKQSAELVSVTQKYNADCRHNFQFNFILTNPEAPAYSSTLSICISALIY